MTGIIDRNSKKLGLRFEQVYIPHVWDGVCDHVTMKNGMTEVFVNETDCGACQLHKGGRLTDIKSSTDKNKVAYCHFQAGKGQKTFQQSLDENTIKFLMEQGEF